MSKFWRLVSHRSLIGFAGLALSAPMWGANTAHPGTVNYVEGQVNIDGQQISQNNSGTAAVEPGQVLETGHGKAEMLLTPGVFLRLGDNSAIRMDSPGLTDTRVAIMHGAAMIEVTELFKQNNIQVADNGANVFLVKKGLYEFNADQPKLAVYDGEAKVGTGDQEVTVKKGKEVALGAAMHASKFNRDEHDGLYQWSSVRSEYLSEASASSARTYVVDGGGWYGGGWYWNPFFSSYSFIPGDGFLYSPFGWGFYSPGFVGYAPYYGYGGYGGGYYRGGRGFSGVRSSGFASSVRSGPALGRGFSSPVGRGGGFSGGGFHGGSMSGGGFHGGGRR